MYGLFISLYDFIRYQAEIISQMFYFQLFASMLTTSIDKNLYILTHCIILIRDDGWPPLLSLLEQFQERQIALHP